MSWVNLSWAVTNVVWWCILYWVLEYFGIWCEAITILSSLLILDFIMWIADTYIKDRTQVTSDKMWKWLVKKMTRWLLPFIVVGIFKWAWIDDMTTVTNMLLSMLIITEWYSIIGHIYSINTWKEMIEIDAFEMLLKLVLNLLKGKLPKDEQEDK